MPHFAASRAFVTVSRAAIDSNFRLLSGLAAGRRIVAVVKADAYGHGMPAVVATLWGAGCRDFAVATVEEGLALRALLPRASVLVLGYTPPAHAREMAAARLTQTVFSCAYAAALSAATDRPLAVALKIEGGMHRLGFSPRALEEIRQAAQAPRLVPTTLFTHFSVADSDLPRTRAALQEFLECHRRLSAGGLSLFTHAAASAALLTLPKTLLDGVRPGLLLYGISPVPTVLPFVPAMSFFAPVVRVNCVSEGETVGYGGDFRAARPSRIGTLAVGYADGLPRAMRGYPLTLLHGKNSYPVSVAGRICMDQMMVDLTDTPGTEGDLVCLWRAADRPAAHLGTIPYEIMTAISPRVERRIL